MSRRKPTKPYRKGAVTNANGVTLALDHQHPWAYMLRAVIPGVRPDGSPLDPVTIPVEMAQAICIQLFENFKCGGPGSAGSPLIRMGVPENGIDVWDNAPQILSVKVPTSQVPNIDIAAGDDELLDVDLDQVPDVSEMDEDLLAATERAITRRRNEILLAENLDGAGAPEGDEALPEHVRARDAQLRGIERQEKRRLQRQRFENAHARAAESLGRIAGDAQPDAGASEP